MAESDAPKRVRKLEKEIDWENGAVTFKVAASGDELICNVSDLPKDIAAKMVPLAVSHRIGDAAAGKDGAEAYESMKKVWEALVGGNFTVRAPAGKKMPSKKAVNEALEEMDPKARKAAEAVLAKLGIQV